VIIAEQVEWVAYEALDARRNDLAAAIDEWRKDWESRDTARLLSHYSASFRTGSQTLQDFGASKQKVNAAKSWIKVGLDSVSLLLYPERPDFALVSFVQDYRSNNLNDRTAKRQFWSRENGRWKIIHETSL
jgi:ketosteroid isomerase-like protein